MRGHLTVRYLIVVLAAFLTVGAAAVVEPSPKTHYAYNTQTRPVTEIISTAIEASSEIPPTELTTVIPETECATEPESLDILTTEVPTVGPLVSTPVATEIAVEPTMAMTEAPEPTVEYFPIFSVCGQVMDIYLQQYLYHQLCAYGIGWWMPYAVIQAFQESGFNIYAENANGLDKGLFQYRTTYWEEAFDIFNPWAQIDCYCRTTAKRLLYMGLDVNHTISRHNTSDYGAYNPVYVEQVMQWLPHLTQLR